MNSNYSSNPHEIRANAYFVKGKVNFQNGNYEKCIQDLQYAETLFSTLNSQKLAAESMLIISHAYLNLNQKDYAISSLKNAFHKFGEIKDTIKKAECALKLGALHREIDDFKHSEDFLNISLSIYSNLGEPELIGDAWKELGNTYQKGQLYEDSLKRSELAYKQAIAYYKKAKLNEKRALVELDLALVLISENKYQDAIKYLEKALTYFKKDNKADFIVTIAIQLAKAYLINSKKKKAQEYYQLAIDTMKKNNYSPQQIEQIKALL